MDSGFSFNIFNGLNSGWEKVFAVLVILMAGWMIGKTIKKAVYRLSALSHKKASNVATLLGSIAQFVVLVISIITALRVSELDSAASSILAGAGILGIALGFALQDIASNLMAGIILSIQKEMQVGDLIKIKEYFGRVVQIDLRMTQLRTLDGQLVYIPNKELLLSTVEDYSHSGKRRITLKVGVSYSDNLDLVKAVTKEAIDSLKAVDSKDPTKVYFTEFGDSSIDLVAMFWIQFEKQQDWLEVRSLAIEAVKKAYSKHQITIPYPISTLLKGDEGNPLLPKSPPRGKKPRVRGKLV